MTLETLKQNCVVTFWIFIVLGFIWTWIAGLCLSVIVFPFSPVFICYVTYIFTRGFKSSEAMSWTKQRWRMWHYLRDYFPAKLHKLADLDPKKTYIMAAVPHGIIGISPFIHFGVEATGFSELYPGLRMRELTMKHFFLTPLVRECCLISGLRHASREGMKNILNSGPGSAVLIVPGGAAEALLAAPNTMDLVIAKRKGFVKLAIETGSCLVPVVAFGENELFDTYVPARGSQAEKLLQALKRNLGFSTPLFWGAGYTKGSKGILPKRVPLNTVVGAPIDVPKYEAQSKDDPKMAALVEEYHAKFLVAVQKLWDDHKDKFAANRQSELRFVE